MREKRRRTTDFEEVESSMPLHVQFVCSLSAGSGTQMPRNAAFFAHRQGRGDTRNVLANLRQSTRHLCLFHKETSTTAHLSRAWLWFCGLDSLLLLTLTATKQHTDDEENR